MIQRKPDLIETDLDHELILLDPVSQEMFSLNDTGRALWRSLPQPDVEALTGILVTGHHAPLDRARCDAAAWLDMVREAGLLLEPAGGAAG
jgi:hypothetical protein